MSNFVSNDGRGTACPCPLLTTASYLSWITNEGVSYEYVITHPLCHNWELIFYTKYAYS